MAIPLPEAAAANGYHIDYRIRSEDWEPKRPVDVHATPSDANQQVEWHFHQRVIPEPLPPFFSRPCVLDNLIYLDDVTDANGPLCVMPGTHLRHEDPPHHDVTDKAGQVALTPPAGSCVTAVPASGTAPCRQHQAVTRQKNSGKK